LKAHVTYWAPDTLDDAIARAVNERASSRLLTAQERCDLVTQYKEQADKWFIRNGQSILIEIDFEADTCRLVPKSEIPF
jgi:hypothetical protein